MPFSTPTQVNAIMELVILTNPQSILDVGVGFGKYGFLCRESLELGNRLLGHESDYGHWRRRIDGVEAFESYITPVHNFIYDTIYLGDALEVVPRLEMKYDLLFLIDVLEHFDREKGAKLLEVCREASRNVLISTPNSFFAQGAVFGNPFEVHKSFWEKKDFGAFSPKCFIQHDESLICYMGEQTPLVKREIYRFKRRIKRWFPFLKYPYRVVKACLGLLGLGRDPGVGPVPP